MGAVTAPPWFVEQMKRLMGLRFAPADLTTHWGGLSDMPAAVLEAAVSRAQKTRLDFPAPAELRQDADAVAHLTRTADNEDRGVELEAPVVIGSLPTGREIRQTRVWTYYCEVCEDSGWASFWCGDEQNKARKPWQPLARCERRREHGSHEWVKQCLCHESNPALIRKRERQQKYAEPPRKNVA